jgi:hypothetical protein
MREGEGSEESIQEVRASVPAETFRPFLRQNSEISDAALLEYFGRVEKSPLQHQRSTEVIIPFAELGKDLTCRRIHSLVVASNRNIGVNLGGMPPAYNNGSYQRISETAQLLSACERNKCSLLAGENISWFLPYQDVVSSSILSKFGALFQADLSARKKALYVFRLKIRDVSTLPRDVKICTLNNKTCKLVAFDATADGTKFVLVEDKQEANGRETREVRLYVPNQEEPVAVYTPPSEAFQPMDVCFWRFHDDTKLLIADLTTDSIHVVDTTDNRLRFERYLAHGSGHLVRPTALNLDEEGRVWIGCDNGWVLRCETITPQLHDDAEPTEDDGAAAAVAAAEMEDDGAAAAVAAAMEDDGADAVASSDTASQLAEGLRVEMASESTEDAMDDWYNILYFLTFLSQVYL